MGSSDNSITGRAVLSTSRVSQASRCDRSGDSRSTRALIHASDRRVKSQLPSTPAIAAIFCHPEGRDLGELGRAFVAQLPAAEAYLDEIAEQGRDVARRFSPNPAPLLALIEQTRQLSRY